MTQSVDDRRVPHGYAVELSTTEGGWGGRVVAASGEKNGGGAGALPLRALAWDMASGTVVAIISVAYCVSFAALIFSGALSPGLSLGLNAILLGTGLTGSLIALTSSLPRAVVGPDTPAIAVFSALAIPVAAAFHQFIVRVLADRLSFANTEIAILDL